MSSKMCTNVVRGLLLILAILDILANIYFLFSNYMEKRDGTYIRYLWQWNLFHIARLATSGLVLLGVIKANLRMLILAAILNGVIFGFLLYAVSLAKFQYNNCERNLCRYSDTCVACERQNYIDYDNTSKWSVFVAFHIIVIIVYAIASTRKEPRQSAFSARNTEIF